MSVVGRRRPEAMSGSELTGRHALRVKFVKPIPTAAIRPLSR